jgi:hypothetical protein
VLNPIEVQVLQLNVVVMQYPPEESVRGNRKLALVEWHEGDDVTIRRHGHLLVAEHDPLVRLHPHPEEPTRLKDVSKKSWRWQQGSGCDEIVIEHTNDGR